MGRIVTIQALPFQPLLKIVAFQALLLLGEYSKTFSNLFSNDCVSACIKKITRFNLAETRGVNIFTFLQHGIVSIHYQTSITMSFPANPGYIKI